MTAQEIDQRHLEFGVGDAMIWFRNIPKLTSSYVFQRLVDSITNQFRGHERRLWHFEIKQDLGSEGGSRFLVTVNHRATLKIQIGREVKDE